MKNNKLQSTFNLVLICSINLLQLNGIVMHEQV